MLIRINPVEPSPIGFRAPVGVALTLPLIFCDLADRRIDPSDLNSQLVLLPHTNTGAYAYDVVVQDPVQGMATVAIPGSTLQDRSGYTIEMYSRDNDGVPGGLLARGKAYLTGSAYKSVGPLGPMVVPTVAGPQGPAGPPGTPGAIWYTGAGDPIIAVANEGDMYLDTVSGNVWRWAAGSWTMV